MGWFSPWPSYQRQLHRLGPTAQDGVRVSAYFDNTCVYKGDHFGKGAQVAKLELAGDTAEITMGRDDVLWTRCGKLIAASGEAGTHDIEIMPEYMVGPQLGFVTARYGGPDITIKSFGATSANIFRNNVLVGTVTLTEGVTTAFNYGSSPYTGFWRVEANGPIMGHRAGNNYAGDSTPLQLPATTLYTWASTRANVSPFDTIPSTFTATPHTGAATTQATGTGTGYNIINTADLATPGGGAFDNYYDPSVAIVITSANSMLAEAMADSDGGNATQATPDFLLRTHHSIPQSHEYISFVAPAGAPVTITEQAPAVGGVYPAPIVHTMAAATVAGGPQALRLGNNGGTLRPAGTLYVASAPLAAVYQPKGAGNTGSDDDETQSLGYNL